MTLAVSLTAPQFHPDLAPTLDAARAVAELGFSGLFLFDHLVPLGDPHRPIIELAAALGAVAASCPVRLGTLVMRAPLRGPDVSAAVAATVARIAPREVVVGLGVGDRLSRDEAKRYGIDRASLADRTRLLEQTITEVRARAPEVEIWVGGTHPTILEVASEQADGWNGWGLDPEAFGEAARRLEGSGLRVTWGGAVLIGRNRSELEDLVARRGGNEGVIAGDTGRVTELLARFRADELIISVLPSRRDRWELFAEEVMAELPGVT